MTEPDLHDDDALLAELARARASTPRLPADARAAAVAAFDVGHLEGELAELVSDTALEPPLVGIRHDGPSDRSVTFTSGPIDIEVELPAGEPILVGQLHPAGPSEVEVQLVDVDGTSSRLVLAVDDLGRFQTTLGPGDLRVHVTTVSGPVTTPWILR